LKKLLQREVQKLHNQPHLLSEIEYSLEVGILFTLFLLLAQHKNLEVEELKLVEEVKN
jgi:hypothetical protein